MGSPYVVTILFFGSFMLEFDIMFNIHHIFDKFQRKSCFLLNTLSVKHKAFDFFYYLFGR